MSIALIYASIPSGSQTFIFQYGNESATGTVDLVGSGNSFGYTKSVPLNSGTPGIFSFDLDTPTGSWTGGDLNITIISSTITGFGNMTNFSKPANLVSVDFSNAPWN
jgi:hypothetical protein